MTHNELLEMIDFEVGCAELRYLEAGLPFTKAIHAVVQLHKPEEFENGPDDYKLVCSHCQLGVIGEIYPCETIQAIEKELG